MPDGNGNDVAFSPDGSMLATVSQPKASVSVWRAPEGMLLHTFEGLAGVSSVAFSPDSAVLAAGCADGRVWL